MQKNNEENKAETYLHTIKNCDYDSTYYQTEAWLQRAGSILQTQNKISKMEYFKKFLYANKMKFAYLFLFAALIFAACAMPVTQETTFGEVLKWTVDKSNADAIKQIETLPWINKSQLTVEASNENGKEILTYKQVLNTTDENTLESYRKQLEGIKAVTTIQVLPISSSVERPLYQAALYSFFRMDIDANNKSDAEIEQEIKDQLKAAGFEQTDLQFGMDAHGMRTFKLTLPERGNLPENKGFEIHVKDGNNVQNEMFLKTMKKEDGEKFKNMTDAEIRDKVRKDSGIPGLKDEEIKIDRSGGNVKISVESDKTGESKDGMIKSHKLQIKTKEN